MAEATLVGSTRVSLSPDTSRFGDLLRVELPKAIRQPAVLAGDLAGQIITGKIESRVRKLKPIVKVGIDLDTVTAKTKLDKLTAKRTVKLGVELDAGSAKAKLDQLANKRTVKVTAELDDQKARAGLDRLAAARTVKVKVELDESAAKTKLDGILGQRTVDILPKLQEAAYNTAKAKLDKLTADRVVNIRATVDTRVAANEIKNLISRRVVRIGADVDTRVAADSLANLTRRRQVTINANADTGAATTALRFLTRDRTVNVRVRSIGLAVLTAGLNSLGSNGGGRGLGLLSSRIFLLAGAAAAALPTIASLGSALAQLGPLAATAAPALSMLIAGFAAIKLGTKGVGDAIKASLGDTSADAKSAATATRQVESAQRSLATAQRGVTDAERSLAQAQRAARQTQDELSAARRQATRDLQDMNAALRQGYLDQKQAALDVEQAELDLQNVRSNPASTQLQIRQADLALERARASADEQARQQKRLAADTKAANKAGVEGSDTVVQAKEKIRQANEQVAAQERALADAHRAVADAARQVSEAHQNAAAQVSKVDQALAKLSPNARQFVQTLRSMAPAWRNMRLEVQDRLFSGLGTRLQQVGSQILPTVRTGLAGTAGQLNIMGKNALNAVSNLERTGQLGKVFDGVRSSLGNLSKIPGQLVTGLAQLSIAAQPAFDRMTKGAGSAMDRVMAKLQKGLESGKLTEAINQALDVAISFGHVLADLFGIVKNIMGAAANAGGDFFAVIGSALKEIRRITALPEVQAALTSVFTAIQAIAKLLAGTLGAVIQAVLPLLAALSPTITALAEALGPVLKQLAITLGAAIMPIIQAVTPIIAMVGTAVIQIVQALMPLLAPFGQLIGMIVKALVPVLKPIIAIVVQVVQQLSGPLATVIRGIMPIIGVLGELIKESFGALAPIITPLIGIVGQIAQLLAGLFAQAIKQLLPVFTPLIPVIGMIVGVLGQLLLQIMRPLMPVIVMIAGLLGQTFGVVVRALAPVLATMVTTFARMLPALMPLVPSIIQLVMAVAQLIPPLLQLGLSVLKPLLPVITMLAQLLMGALGAAMSFLIPIVVRVIGWVLSFATIIAKVVKKIVGFFQWLFDVLLGHSIIPDIVNGTIKFFTNLWHKTVEIFRFLKDGALRIWNAFWDKIKSVASTAWGLVKTGFGKFADALKTAFRGVRDGIGKIWNGIKALVMSPVKFWIDVIYNRGIVSVWNATAAKIPGVPDLHKMNMPKGFARGGILPGWSTFRQGDDQLVPMRRGEGVYVSEAMRDPYERARLHAVNQAAMSGRSLSQFRGFSIGGILGDAGSAIGSGVGKVLSKGADVARGGLADLAESAFKPITSGIRKALGTNVNGYQGMIGKAPLNIIEKTIDWIRGKDKVESGLVGVGRWVKPVKAGFGTPFGKKGSMWSSGRHTGLDFPAPTGTKVVAVDTGTVKSATSGGPYGKHVEIKHGGGLSSLYAHMSAMVAKAGETIKQGARVGSVGATGNVTGPHLHLEARINGRSVDPMPYLTGNAGGDGGHGVQRWRGVVQQVLGQLHESTSLTNTVLRRMNQESGGNPRAVNKWDSNWKAGHPSVGLMQVIEGTFRRYAGKYRSTGPFMYGVSIDPTANLYASGKYARANYGSLSRAYNRKGGYATGGIVGAVRINRGLGSGGYASGGIIRVGGKRIDTGPIAASVGKDFLKALTGTASAINAAMTKVATALKNAFKGVKTTLDDKLLAQVKKQNSALQALAKQRDDIKAKIAAAAQLSADATGQATQFTALTSLPNGGNDFGAEGILSGLNVRLGQLKAFGKNLQILNQRGLSKTLLQQIITAGPDGGAAYAQALVDATPDQLKDINATQDAIAKASTAFGKDAADAMYDAGSQSGKGYLTGLAAQQKDIENAMSKLAKAIQASIRTALKIKSPSVVFRQLGAFTVQGFAQGMEATIPQAVAAATRMAAVVRSTAAGARLESNTTTNNGGDRHLHYNATVREIASRKSILDALAVDDMLHRSVMVGG
ncbi:peptidoglycan DD-metalloendopeptidase family protein [Streptomyces sp. NPDC056105]|uniref:peptidoglycan DD-metalloendopeptidase family protein n=1 Tax=Streptomyces sp. NPDC056105 TaxID=3345714 RepID=UPI0035D7E530